MPRFLLFVALCCSATSATMAHENHQDPSLPPTSDEFPAGDAAGLNTPFPTEDKFPAGDAAGENTPLPTGDQFPAGDVAGQSTPFPTEDQFPADNVANENDNTLQRMKNRARRRRRNKRSRNCMKRIVGNSVPHREEDSLCESCQASIALLKVAGAHPVPIREMAEMLCVTQADQEHCNVVNTVLDVLTDNQLSGDIEHGDAKDLCRQVGFCRKGRALHVHEEFGRSLSDKSNPTAKPAAKPTANPTVTTREDGLPCGSSNWEQGNQDPDHGQWMDSLMGEYRGRISLSNRPNVFGLGGLKKRPCGTEMAPGLRVPSPSSAGNHERV